MVPVQDHLFALGCQVDQLAARKVRTCLDLGDESIAQAGEREGHEALGRGHDVVWIAPRIQPEVAQQEGLVHVVVVAEDDRRRARQRRRGETLREPARAEVGRAGAQIGHGPEAYGGAAAHRIGAGGHATQHLAVGEQRVGVVLVVDHAVEHDALVADHLGDRADEPGGERIGVDAHCETQRPVHLAWRQRASRLRLHQAQLCKVGQQPAPGRRGPHRLAAHQQNLAELGLEQLDPLRHRGLGQRQPARRALESALLQHRLEGQQAMIDH